MRTNPVGGRPDYVFTSGHKVHDRAPALEIDRQRDVLMHDRPSMIPALTAGGRTHPEPDLSPVLQRAARADEHGRDRDVRARRNPQLVDILADPLSYLPNQSRNLARSAA